ncbi:hypothetical protein HY387_01145 [Candidatus Daviesbacteria bacterium]|nr:hypothetical protein [Candidatus Daviesbacteria bacterium]
MIEDENRLYIPPRYIKDQERPVIFLAGPIVGAWDWQAEATSRLLKENSHILVANPRRPELNADFDYATQVEWETDHLKRASQLGVILFWLANEVNHYHERPFGQTTRIELGEWMVRHVYERTRIVLGIDWRFPGAKYIRDRFQAECPNVPIKNTLAQTCLEALKLLK